MSDIAKNIKTVYGRIERAAEKSGRKHQDITLVAVSKTFPAEYIIEAAEHGITDIGENRVQETLAKYELIGNRVKWHLVGHLQTNKVRKTVGVFDLIHSVESVHLAEEINKRNNNPQKILVEVNTTEEESKFGVGVNDAVNFVREISELPNIAVMGLMTIGVFSADPEESRGYFITLRELKEKIEQYDLGKGEMKYLSMGMSNDFETAIEEGANIVRVGTAIFGSRHGY